MEAAMAFGWNKFWMTAIMGGTLAFAGASSSWAMIDYTQKNGSSGFNLEAFMSQQLQGGAALQALAQANGIQQMAQGGLGGMLAGGMFGNLDPSQLAQQMAQQMVRQAVNQLMDKIGLGNFGGLAGDLVTGGLSNFGGLAGSGTGALAGAGGGTLIGPVNFSNTIGGMLEGAVNQAITGGIQTAMNGAMGGGSSGSGGSSSGYTPSNNFGGAIVGLDADAPIDKTSSNYNAGLNAVVSGRGMSSDYLINPGTSTAVYDSNYLQGYLDGQAYYNTASN